MKILEGIKAFFKELWAEIMKLIEKPEKPEMLTALEMMKKLQSYSKNQLVQALINLLAEKERLIPDADKSWRKAVKGNYSKKRIIKQIMGLMIEQNHKADKGNRKNLDEKLRKGVDNVVTD